MAMVQNDGANQNPDDDDLEDENSRKRTKLQEVEDKSVAHMATNDASTESENNDDEDKNDED